MKYRTRFTEGARAEIRKIELGVARRILRKLADLEADPYGYDTTALVGDPDVRRLRVGAHRVIYEVVDDDLLILVVHVGHRRAVYRVTGS